VKNAVTGEKVRMTSKTNQQTLVALLMKFLKMQSRVLVILFAIVFSIGTCKFPPL
jgi:hypothetical protein